MSEQLQKEDVMKIFSLGISILSKMPDCSLLVMYCRRMKAKINGESAEIPDIHDLNDFFEMDVFIKYELNIIYKCIESSKTEGISVSHIQDYLPQFATPDTPKLLLKYLKCDRNYSILNDVIFTKEYAPKESTRRTLDESMGKRKILSLNRNLPSSALNTTMDKKTFDKIYSRLLKKIGREFDRKFFIGDIVISDDEYNVLCELLTAKCKAIIQSGTALTDNPAFAVALVQIGIRKYQSNRFWPYVNEATNLKINSADQGLIGTSFINTLKAHNKHVESESERVSSILFHTFVSNYYSRGLFELLFQYYSNDLERDIHRNDKEQMNALMEMLAEKSLLSEKDSESFTDQFMERGRRAYKLRQHTLQAISENQSHSRTRLRRFIRLIDKAFWKDYVPKNPTSRLTIQFKEWVNESAAFKHEYEGYKMGTIRNRGKKHFSTPYLFADISNSTFSLKLPAQIVKEDYSESLQWEINTVKGKRVCPVETYQVLTGFKSVEGKMNIDLNELFGSIICELKCDDVCVRKFMELEESNFRFFDMEGDYSSKLFHIPMCAYTPTDVELKSPAHVDHIFTKGLIRWDFSFEKEDLVFLPDGRSMVVGENYEDGYASRGKEKDCVYRGENFKADVYSSVPNLILTIPQSKIQGTLIDVNGKQYKLGDCKYIEFESEDAKGTRAFYIECAQFQEIKNYQLNNIFVDIPGGTPHRYSFAYVNGLQAKFDGSPYIFEERGTISFPDELNLECTNDNVEYVSKENEFQFLLTPELPELDIKFRNQLLLHFKVPVFMWSWDKAEWHTEPMGEMWSSEFFRYSKLYIRFPSQIEIGTDDDEDDDEDADVQHSVKADNSGDNAWEVDLTRFKTWISRDKLKYPIKVITGAKSYTLAEVYSKSYVVSSELSADYEQGILIIKSDIIGNSEYYVDIIHLNSHETIADKLKLNDGKALINCAPANGTYRVEIFETEKDDSGFEGFNYLPVHSHETSLINKYDFSGQNLRVCKFKATNGIQYYENIKGAVYISSLEKTSRNEYDGMLWVNGNLTGTKAHVIFSDNEERSYKLFFYDEDYLEPFEFDSRKHQLVRNAEEDFNIEELTSSEKYRRFKMLFDEDYDFFGPLEDTPHTADDLDEEDDKEYVGIFNSEKAARNPLALSIKELGLTVETYELLKQTGMKDIFDVTNVSEDQIRAYGYFKTRHIEEIKEILDKLGRHFREVK